MNQICDSIINVLSKADHIVENLELVKTDVRNDISLIAIDRKTDNLVREINSLRVGFLELLCSEILKKEEAEKGNEVKTINEKENSSCDKVEFFSK